MFVDSVLSPTASTTTITGSVSLASALQKNGAKAYVAMNISIPMTKSVFLARSADFIVC